jgi:hypothetical protein
MKKIVFVFIALTLPVLGLAEEKSMQNADPNPTTAPEHVMQNVDPSPAEKPEHVMQNANPNASSASEASDSSESKAPVDIQHLPK